MNIFIIHSGKDRERVDEQFVKRLKTIEGTDILLLKNGGALWKWDAKKKIKKAQMVFCVLSETSAQSENIAWEILTAIHYRKCIYFIRLDRGAPIPKALYAPDEFSREEKLRGKEAKNLEDVIKRIKDYVNGTYDVFNTNLGKGDQSEILTQYKLFLETSENLVARRQNVNNFYLSANAALISALAVIGRLREGDMDTLLWTTPLISVIGIVLSFSWRRLLEAYGTLNACKMKVINLIEAQLPLKLYRAEWDVMSDKLNNKRYVSFTENEKRLPLIFIMLYGLLLLLAISFGLYSLRHPIN